MVVDRIVPDITAEHDDIGVSIAFNGLLNGFNVIPVVYGFDPLHCISMPTVQVIMSLAKHPSEIPSIIIPLGTGIEKGYPQRTCI